jgi:hypothetical protein
MDSENSGGSKKENQPDLKRIRPVFFSGMDVAYTRLTDIEDFMYNISG